MLAGVSGRALDFAFGAAEARRGRGLNNAGDLVEGVARAGVRVIGRFPGFEHGSEADVGAFEDLFPFGAALGAHDGGDAVLHFGPAGAIVLLRQGFLREAGELEQFGVELRLDRAERDVLAIERFVGVVVVRAGVEHVGGAPRFQKPEARPACSEVISELAPSTMAASTTWPLPVRWVSISAPSIPTARYMPPPPKSPTRLSGGTGACPTRPIGARAPASAM